ncbi:hypothetical protein QQ045_030833 [Rhodiola kirilowii]
MDFGYQQYQAPLCNSLSDNKHFTVPSSSLTPSYYDLNGSPNFSGDGFPALEFQYEPLLIPQQSFNPTVIDGGFHQFDPMYASLDIVEHQNDLQFPDDLQVCGRTSIDSNSIGTENIFGSPLLWSDAFITNGLDNGVALSQQTHLPVQMSVENEILVENGGQKSEMGKDGRTRRSRKRSARQMGGDSCAESLTWEILSQYFYMPIAQAARELNIGLTLFKKRCRELGVRRWPHRKLMSINSLIKNVKEMEKDREVDPAMSKGTFRNAIEVLETQRKMMEVMPDIQLEEQTKRLRQACFKANYKKRRLMIMNGGGGGGDLANSSNSTSSSGKGNESTTASSTNIGFAGQDLETSDELRSLLFDALSPSDCSFLDDYI